MPTTRLYYCCDIHGSDVCFRKALNIAKYGMYQANIIIVGGDLTGKMIVPISRQVNGEYYCQFLETKHILRTEEELADMKKLIANSGFYPYIGDPSEIEEIRRDRARFNELIDKLILERMQGWMTLADERLANLNVQFFMLQGNDDHKKCSEIISTSKYVKNPEGKVVDLDGVHEMVSSGASNFTPWKTPGEYSEEQLEQMFESMMSQVKSPSDCVLNFHVPPYDSGLDVAPKLDEELKPVMVGGEPM